MFKTQKTTFPLILNYINILSLMAITAVLLFRFNNLTRIFYYIFFVSYVIEIFVDKKWRDFHFDKIKLYFLVMELFFFLAIFYLPFEDTNKYTHILLEKRLSLAGMAVVGFFGVNRLYKLKYFLYVFIIVSISSIFYLVFYRIGFMDFIKTPHHSEIFTQMRILYVNHHMVFNLYLNISIISIWYLFQKNGEIFQWWKKGLLSAALLTIMFTLFISEGRTGFIAGTLLCLTMILIELYKRWKKMGIIFMFILPVLFVGILGIYQKRLTLDNVENDPRTFLSKTGWEVIKEHPFWGQGINGAQTAFDKKLPLYESEDFVQYARLLNENNNVKYQDCHNQYIQTTMEFGIPGLLILLFLYISPVFLADLKRREFNRFIVFLYMFSSIFDMFLTRMFSPLFGILTIMMLAVEQDEKFMKSIRLRKQEKKS